MPEVAYQCRFCGEEHTDADPSEPCPDCEKRGWYLVADGGVESGEAIVLHGDKVDYHRGQCKTCNLVETNGPAKQDFDNLERFLGRHIDDGSACDDYRIDAVFDDGGEHRVV